MLKHPCSLLSQAQQDPDVHSYIGVHGTNKIVRLLWYMDYNNICLCPFVHAFYRGVFRDWMLAIFSPPPSSEPVFLCEGKAPLFLRSEHVLSGAQRAECKRRAATLTVTNEFSRAPECPITYGRQQVMDQLIRQLDCVLPLLFAEVCSTLNDRH